METHAVAPLETVAQDPDRVIPFGAVKDLVGNVHPATIWRWIGAGKFPAPIKIGGRVFWREAEIRAYLRARFADRQPAA